MPLLLHYRDAGSPRTGQPPILLLHGLFGSQANWGSVARRLAAGQRVIAVDLRNHGQSFHAPRLNYPDMAADVLALLDALAIPQAIVVGHSMGGKVAMQLALTRPERVAGLAVVDIAPVTYAHDFGSILGGFAAVDLPGLISRGDADRAMQAYIPQSGVRAFLLQNLVRDPSGWRWRVNLDAVAACQGEIVGFPLLPGDARYAGTAHFIHGGLSDYVLPYHRQDIDALFPRARLCCVADAGHWVYAERPDGFAACLEQFLDVLRSERG